MSSVGMLALFYSVTVNQSTPTFSSGSEKKLTTERKDHIRKNRSASSSPVLTTYMSSPREVIERYLFGFHAKTKRSLAEEAESGDEISVNSWIRDGVDPNECDAYGYTPLLNASALGRLNAAKELVKNGADVNKAGPFGFTALHAAAQNGHREVVSFLLRNGADINAQNQDLDTPMHLALRAQRIEIVYMLLRNGGNSRIEGFNRKNCIQCAKDCGLFDLAETLKNYNLFTGYHPFSSPAAMSLTNSIIAAL